MTRRCALIAGMLATLVAAPARARAEATLVVFHAPAGAHGQVARAAIEQAARERGAVMLDVSPAPAALPRAADGLRRAIEAYQSFRYDAAHEELGRALAEAEATGADGLTQSELGELYIYTALVESQRGDATLAWDGFVRAATIDPTRQLDPVRFPPRVIETHQRAIEAMSRAEHGDVVVAVDAACEVWLDARRVRAGDAVRVVRGHHYVRVRCPGHEPYGARVEVGEPAVEVKPALVAQAPPTVERVRALAAERGATTLILAAITVSPDARPTLSLRLVDVATGAERTRVLKAAPEQQGAAAEVREALRGLIDGVLTRAAPPAPRPGPTPWYRKPWVWGVAGAAATALVLMPLVVDSDPAPGFGVRLGGDLP